MGGLFGDDSDSDDDDDSDEDDSDESDWRNWSILNNVNIFKIKIELKIIEA